MMFELFSRFVLISLLAFGGGQAALPLIERIAVNETGWVSPQDFAAAVAFGYVTPGPVLITATFVGYAAAGLGGAFAATFGVFLMPWALAAAAAQQLQRFLQHAWLRGFGRGAAPAVVGLLAVTALDIARHAFVGWPCVLIAAIALPLALWTKVHPILLLLAGAGAGMAIELLSVA
ncbi:MAG TPA: chromate transporter [Candidatus Binatia bacterium]|jgi:chromate transporter|nr:chromate transporter [Candidatus Binatia bacterium]